ncbi:hypothetical protein DPMN_051135 [Dreissena polymorpha]|uniref:Uncharacterized protein n=1 Tax=Dreissena polymorpha TaxID=45954 RepID=A0A9D4CJE2_DREPO|nr:hypothetical protein DPMN_051135 [Dreissena polymorpha]
MQDMLVGSMARLSHRWEMKTAAYFFDNDAFPVIGSRIRRGPDMIFDNQDNFGPGSAVGHSEHGLT